MSHELKLLEDETVLVRLKPHPLSFYELYIIWIWVIVLGIVFISYGDKLGQLTGNPLSFMTDYMDWMTSPKDNMLIRKIDLLPNMAGLNSMISPVNNYFREYSEIGLWLTILIMTAVPIAAIRIEFTWGPILLAVGVASFSAAYLLDLEPYSTYYFSIVISLGGLYLVNIYRKAHNFYITNKRIVTESRLFTKKSNELSYDKVNNIVMEQGIVGSIFGFGTVIPVTASGLGMGSDAVAMSLGVASERGGTIFGGGITGERSIQLPRTRSMYALFGVSKPDEIRDLLSKQMHGFVQAPYLKKMTEQLEDIKKSMPNK